MTDSQKKMILDWMRKIHQLEYAHRYDSIMWSNRDHYVAMSAFAISTLIVFTYQFPSLGVKDYNQLCLIFKQSFFVPFASLIVAILTGVQTFLRPGEKSELHKKTASNYEQLRHKIEQLLMFKSSDSELESQISSIRGEWGQLEDINVTKKHFEAGKAKVTSFKKYPRELDFLKTTNQ